MPLTLGLDVKKLTLTLVTAMLTAIIFLGWGIDNLFNEYQRKEGTDEFALHKQLITSLAFTLDKIENVEQFISIWQSQNQQQLSLTPLAEFPLPASLQQNFSQGQPLILESEDFITVNQLLPSKQGVLSLSVAQTTKQHDILTIQIILTTAFYSGILLCAFIWIYPLIKRLQLLQKTAKAFGEGDLSQRIHLVNTSYIVDIENEFNNMAEKIAILLEDNKLLCNAVSHDLRTPLARLRFGIEALSETNSPQNKEKYVKHLSRDIEEMETLVGVLLNYARLEQKMVKVQRIPLKVNKLLHSAVASFASSEQSLVAIDTSGLTDSNLSILGDENYLSMLINNLLTNAQQYAAKKITISTQSTDKGVMLCVCDDGPGIAPNKRDELFKPFTRGDIQLSHKGYGMGLAIVHRVALWHGAQVSISQSDELGGAQFTVLFPQ
ncbi:ATP-binding protein [Pseudoalteromonas tunicata]|uniref:ATP-binding protein n=1 Tax=Pseudoalteromonas tunicata TaxID=314281 RepID=UPI000321315E|nr:ATP-binding protein [Pseudoalteromonas tunicata]ATC96876.1 two-component system, OmpR family, sensor kinase [Pseudoalteromonas tunicata]MDP4985347.1 ATP-binding protein [Pseudoalteromonas tunicata]